MRPVDQDMWAFCHAWSSRVARNQRRGMKIGCRISAFNRQRVAAVAVANRHTVALLEGGTVFSWGSNLQGQLGYGTADSASNPVPRIVEAMKVFSQPFLSIHCMLCFTHSNP